MRSVPSVCGSGKRGGSQFAFVASRRRLQTGASHTDASALTGAGTATSARTAVGDLRLLFRCNSEHCLYDGRAVAWVCLDGPAGAAFRAGLAARIDGARLRFNAGDCGGNPVAGPGDLSGRIRRIARELNQAVSIQQEIE